VTDLKSQIHEPEFRARLDIPPPGRGDTLARHRSLADWGREDLSLARIAEAHTDATAILYECGITPRSNVIYGVWASDGPQSLVVATPEDGQWRIAGVKQYCSGSSIVDAALVTAHTNDGLLLFDIPLDAEGVTVCPSNWANAAFADTATGPVSFAEVRVGAHTMIGHPGWYLARPGFWHGAIGPAACWAGGAMSLIDSATRLNRRDAHSRAHIGALQSIEWGMDAILTQAAREIDDDPSDLKGNARTRALKVRHLIERWCTEVLDRFGRATGPQLLAFDEAVARQYAALALYIRQCHAERDLETVPTGAEGSAAVGIADQWPEKPAAFVGDEQRRSTPTSLATSS
jgi:alkylation response protein AidB-like acyl-CoA dehydrogenase